MEERRRGGLWERAEEGGRGSVAECVGFELNWGLPRVRLSSCMYSLSLDSILISILCNLGPIA